MVIKGPGIFSNNDDLSDKLLEAGRVSEIMFGDYRFLDLMIKVNSQFADMKNIGMGGAGSITAAQFLKRFF
ncbi:MAG: hypothetical protein CM15mP29_3240 [Alphaproteobacteria bacterium]|nr:MAG: hypothetical protein CM15mP29_3240 [Alphaproteobacteria bacterium]